MANSLFWALIATVALAPLPFASNRPWAWGLLGLFVGVQLVAFSVAALFNRELIQLSWRRYALAMLGFAVLVVWFVLQESALSPRAWHNPLWRDAEALLNRPLAGAVAVDPGAARETVLRLLAYAGIFVLSIQLCRSRERARLALWSLALAGTAYAIYGLATYLGGYDKILWYDKIAYRDSLTSTFVNRNSFAAYCGLTLIAALAMLHKESEEGMRYGLFSRMGLVHFIESVSLGPFVLIVSAFVIATALLFTKSRGGFFATGVGVITLAVAIRLAHRRRHSTGGMPIFLLSILAAALVLVSFSGEALLGRLSDFAGREAGRGAMYAGTLRAIADHPLTGIGLGGFHHIFPMYRDSRLDGLHATVDRAHNTYLELALEIGPPAFLLMVAILGGIAIVCARGLLVRQRDLVYPAAGVSVLALMAFHSLIDFSLQMPAVAAAFSLLVGTAYAQSFSTARSDASSSAAQQSARA
jgi:O-antigen ligase